MHSWSFSTDASCRSYISILDAFLVVFFETLFGLHPQLHVGQGWTENFVLLGKDVQLREIGCPSALFPSSDADVFVLHMRKSLQEMHVIYHNLRLQPLAETLPDLLLARLDWDIYSPPYKLFCKEWSLGGRTYRQAWKTCQALTAKHTVRPRARKRLTHSVPRIDPTFRCSATKLRDKSSPNFRCAAYLLARQQKCSRSCRNTGNSPSSKFAHTFRSFVRQSRPD